MNFKDFLRNLWKWRKILIVVLTPILFLPMVLLTHAKETQCAYVVFIMAVFWITEALPIAITSVLPILLFPLVGMMSAKDVSSTYVNDTSMLFLGNLIVAAAIEHWNIHTRIALRLLLIFGSEPHWLLLGMMLPTWFLSMWISNTATTAMMMPIANAIVLQLKEASGKQSSNDYVLQTQPDNQKGVTDTYENNVDDVNKNTCDNFSDSNERIQSENLTTRSALIAHKSAESYEDQEFIKMGKALSLCIAYSANIGGTASLTGTITNVIMQGQSDIVYRKYNSETPVTFTSWLQFGLPVSFVVFLFLWLWSLVYFLRCRMFKCCYSDRKADFAGNVSRMIKMEYEKLGSMNFCQGAVLGHFCLLAILLITRNLGDIGGWGRLFPDKTVTDSTPCLLIAVSLFVFPQRPLTLLGKYGNQSPKPLLPWRVAEKTVPWGVIILLGGGFALAKGCNVSGLSSWLGNHLILFGSLEPWLMIMILCYVIAFATEVTLNSAICTLMMPILADMALSLHVNPLYFMFPGAIASSFAFMLPAATPPNAVVFSYGYVRVRDMVVVGIILNVISVLILVAMTETLGVALFDLHTFPDVLKNISYTSPDGLNMSQSMLSANNNSSTVSML